MRLPSLLLSLALVSPACGQTGQIAIPAVEKMPELPQPYELRDWKKVARDFDAIAFDFTKSGEFLPLPWWDDSRTDHDITGFGLPAYVGDLRQTPKSNNYDAITCLGSVLGGTMAGIDKSNQDGRNWVSKLKIYYSQKNGTNLYMNNPGGRSGHSFWYELLPSLLFFQIHDRYPNEPEMRNQLVAIAERWHGGCLALGASGTSAPDFDHTAFNFTTGQPFDNPRWREPDAAAGVAWLEYMAFAATGEKKFLQAAQWAMEFLAERKRNPFYECLMPYGAYVSARMNAEQGTTYPTDKLIRWVFDGDNPREWGVVTEKWGSVPAHGLQGSVHNGSEYAFTMNSFLAPAVMVPLVRYDDRYARAMGKWVLNVAVNSRLFYANAWKPEEQTSWDWASAHDKNFAIAYEGLRKQGMRRDRPSGVTQGEKLVPDAWGRIERIWRIEVPPGPKHTLVLELDSKDGQVTRAMEVFLADAENGPWRSTFRFARGDKNRKWTALKQDGPLWVKLRADPVPGEKSKALAVEQVFVETRLDLIPHASGDPLFHGWGKTDLGLYGSAFVGMLAALVEPSNVEGILRIDCRATESFAAPSFPTWLYYNPHRVTKSVRVPVGSAPADVYDTVSNRVVARNATQDAEIVLPPNEAAVFVVCPAGGNFESKSGRVVRNGVVVDYRP